MGIIKNSTKLKLRANSNCWMCEGWSEYSFEFATPEKIDPLTVPVRLHLSTDDYEGVVLALDKEKSAHATAQNPKEVIKEDNGTKPKRMNSKLEA